MGLYDDVVAFLERVEKREESQLNSRERWTSQQVEALRQQFPGVPPDFLAYLQEVGSGAFRECQFTVYDFLGSPDDVLSEGVLHRGDPHPRVLCFGDNFSGDMSGFLPDHGWDVVELWHEDGTIWRESKPFSEYIREQMLMGPEGEDLRAQ